MMINAENLVIPGKNGTEIFSVRLKGSTPCATVLQEIIRGYIIDLSEPLKTLCFRGFFAISDMTKIPPGVR